jgi:uncharacterized protein YjbI with pentapeptide repeats
VNIVNDSGMKFVWLAGRVPPRPLTGTFIVKGTFEIKPGQPAALSSPEDQLDADGEKTLDDDPAAGPVYPGDFALFKPRAEILLTGSAQSPQGEPITAMPVALHVGSWSKSLMVFGDRIWTFDGLSDPLPFTTMPLVWERAFGGPSFKQNPCGRGAEPVSDAGGRRVQLAPNIEYLRQLVTSASSRPAPASFAPLGASWPQRTKNLGTYDGSWLRKRWPWLPDDFDWTYFNAALEDQRLQGFLRGDETIVLEGMSAEHARIETALPSLRPRWFMRQKVNGEPVFGEIPLNLDTLFIDAEKMRIVVQWRGVVSIYSLKMKEVTDHLLVSEPLGEPDKGLSYFEALLERRKIETRNEGEEPEAEEADSPFPLPDVPPLDMSWLDAFEDGMAKETADANRWLADMKAFWAARGQDIPHTVPIALAPVQPIAFADIENGLKSAMGPVRELGSYGAKLASKQWLDPNLAKDMEEMDKLGEQFESTEQPPPEAEGQPWTRERVEQHHRANGSFEDQPLDGLDLAGLDLGGARFKGASLANCNVSGTALDGAVLDGAVLEGAILREATLTAASLKGADLTNVQGALAVFSGATLDDAVFVGAGLQGARFENARGVACDFAGADLTQADLRGAVFERSDFSQATLDMLRASGSSLVSCDVGQARAVNADFTGARVRDLRATGADFHQATLVGVSGEQTAWDGSNLAGANMMEAELPGALFDGADLTGAVLDGASLVRARLCDTNLTGARFVDANLFRATLEGALIKGSVFTRANMYEVEFFQAAIEGAQFEGANLKGTKLA